MPYCFVVGCANSVRTSGGFFSFHCFPKEKKIRAKWLEAIGRNPNFPIIYERVCSEHFADEDITKHGSRRVLRANVLPCKNLPSKYPARKCLQFPEPVSEVTCMVDMELPGTSSSTLSPLQLSQSSSSSTSSNVEKEMTRKKSGIKKSIKKRYKYSSSSDTLSQGQESVEKSPSSATSSTKRRIIKTFHTYSLSPENYKKQILKHERRAKLLKMKYEATKKTSRRRYRKITSLKEIVINVKKKYRLSTDAATVLESTFSGIPLIIMRRMIQNLKRRRGKAVVRSKYPKELRSFAMTLQFYSSKAYNYVRNTFDMVLPAPSTIRSWMSKIDCSPGFTKPALESLKIRVDEFRKNTQQQLLGCLILDEMAIKKGIIAEKHSQTLWGYVDVGGNTEISNNRDEASEVLVLMIVGVNDNFKLPIAYFFINKLTGEERANIVMEALRHIHYTDIKILALTCDGPQVHFKMMSALGCKILDLENLKTWFQNPLDGSKVHVIFDVCHMLKLMRNNWAVSEIFLDIDGCPIKWDYIEKLHNIQQNEGLYLGNKLRKKHMQWKKSIMKVKLAAQTLSNSVADALEFLCLDLNLEDFRNVMPTVRFIRKCNDLFDVLNSRNPFGKDMHTPMRCENENYWKPVLEDTLIYIKNLKQCNGTFLYKTQKKVPFLGFIVSTTSLIQIYEEEVKLRHSLKYLLTYKFSQDHLELFFCSIRCRNGSNNNPNCLQFCHTYRRMLMHIDVKNKTGNCLAQDDTNILEVSSSNRNPEITDINIIRRRESEVQELEDKIELFLPIHLNEYSENVISYISGFVVEYTKKIVCLIYVGALVSEFDEQDNSLKLIRRKSRGGLLYASRSVCEICKKIEKKIQITFKVLGNLPPRDSLIIILRKEVNNFLIDANIFPCLEEHVFDYAPYETSHKKTIIQAVIDTFASIRLNSLANKLNENIAGERVRKSLSKLILFRHQ